MNVLRKYWGFGLALLSGVMLAMCFPGYNVGGLVWLWSVPLMVALWCGGDSKRPKLKKN